MDELCFVGDRLLTDVVFGNLHGMLTFHTRPLSLKGDNLAAVVFRFLERKVSAPCGGARRMVPSAALLPGCRHDDAIFYFRPIFSAVVGEFGCTLG